MRKYGVILIGILIATVMISGCSEKKPKATVEIDTDGDGYNDSVDVFPHDHTEWNDSDDDGVGDNADAFPFDANETRDTDADGVGDHADAFPLDPTEWRDSDGDGVGDNADYYPLDPTRWEQPSPDAFLVQAEPFVEKVVLNDSALRSYADAVLSGCDASDTECQLNALYRDVLMNYTCIPAPLDNSSLQTPQETIAEKQGTCEDLSILLCSLLNTIGISSSLVFTDTHVYALAIDVNTSELWDVADQSLRYQVEKQFGEPLRQSYVQTYTLPSMNMLYVGGEEGKTFTGLIDYMSIDYRINSDHPLHLFIVPTQTEFFALRDGDLANFTHYGQWEQTNVTTAIGSIPQLFTFGGIVLVNEGAEVATVAVDFFFSFRPSFYATYNANTLTTYTVGGKHAVLLDLTLGEYGFPGYDAQIAGEKKAIDPHTKEYVTLP